MKRAIKNYLQKLDDWDCLLVLLRVLRLHIRRIPVPITLALRSTVVTFVMLFWMPYHPISIPIAFGGGLCSGIIWRSLELTRRMT